MNEISRLKPERSKDRHPRRDRIYLPPGLRVSGSEFRGFRVWLLQLFKCHSSHCCRSQDGKSERDYVFFAGRSERCFFSRST